MSVIQRAAERLRGARHMEWVLLAVLLAAALLMTADGPDETEGATSLEKRMESVLSCIAGAGEVRVLVCSGDGGQLYGLPGEGGVLVVAQGASDLKVSMELQRAVQALLGVRAEQIEILAMEEGER